MSSTQTGSGLRRSIAWLRLVEMTKMPGFEAERIIAIADVRGGYIDVASGATVAKAGNGTFNITLAA